MKVGTLTFHRAINLGAVLQAYALSEYIKKTGNECDIIDYRCEYIENHYKKSKFFANGIKGAVVHLLCDGHDAERKKKFSEFSDKYLPVSKKAYTENDLKTANQSYDKFITGSDQVWNYAVADFDKAYFLDFVTDSKKKLSYAASFGFDKIPEDKETDYYNLLNDFNHISVREASAVDIVKDLASKDATQVLDPVFLLSADDWNKLTEKDEPKEKYILIYAFCVTENILKKAQELSNATGYKIYGITFIIKPLKGLKQINAVGPLDFLNLIKNAEFVVTNSFHGTAFSIIYNKKFFVEYYKLDVCINARFDSILGITGLENRCISNFDTGLLDTIDYDAVNEKLDEERKKSYDFLKKVIGNNEQN